MSIPKWKTFTKEEIFKFAQESRSKTEFCKKMGYSTTYAKLMNDILNEYKDLDISHFNGGLIVDMKGQRIGRLTVIEYAGSKNGKAAWKCKCDCGNETVVTGDGLRNPPITKSCGCLQKETASKMSLMDLTGKQFGYLTVLKRDKTKPSGHELPVFWICECKCGNIISVMAENLRTGNSQSCGCSRESHGEILIREFLEQHNIIFIQEYKFLNLKDKRPLKFDFVIFNKNNLPIAAIEFQGIQHFKPVEFWGGEEAFQKQLKRDTMKIDFCNENNIKLITYNYKQKSTDILQMLEQELSNWIY